ncbi:hypothetical protein [Sphingomonas suaedae]|nr:hypothetical protein [Sphingomonas suaedae]
MTDHNDPQHIETDRARAGATPHMTRYILAISLVLIVAIYAIYLLL